MARLPDIPIQSWVQDQAEQFEAQTKSVYDAMMFKLASRQMEADGIPPDFPNPGGEDTLTEQERINEELKRQQEEEARRQQEEEAARQQQEQDAQKQQSWMEMIAQEASRHGIPTPGEVADQFFKGANRPTTTPPDNTGSAVLDNPAGDSVLSSMDQPSPTPDLGDPMSGTTEPQRVSTVDDFNNFVNNTWSGAKTAFQNAGQTISDYETAQHDPASLPLSEPRDGQMGPPGPMNENHGFFEDLSKSTLGPMFADATKKWMDTFQADSDEQKARSAAGLTNNRTASSLSSRIPGRSDIDPNNPLAAPEPTPLPEAQTSEDKFRDATATTLNLPLKVVGAVADLLTGDPGQTKKFTDPYGIMDALGISEGMTTGEIASNVAPTALMHLPQLFAMGAQMVQAPVEMGTTLVGMGILGRLAPLLKTPGGQRFALATVGALVGGADAYLNQRDVLGGGSGTATSVTREAEAGALTGLATKRVIPPAIRMFKDILSSPTAVDAYRYMDQLATKVGSDVIDNLTSKYPALQQVTDATRTSVPRGWDVVPAMGEGQRMAREAGEWRAPYGTAVGAASGAVAGYEQGQENDSLLDRAARIGTGALIGAPVGRFAAREGTIAAGKVLDSAISRGLVSPDVLSTHPATADRIRALFAMAAGDKPDNAVISLPNMASFLSKTSPEVRQEIPEFFQPNLTAGDVRRMTNNPTTLQNIYNNTTSLLADIITATRNSKIRAGEYAADRATIMGIPQEMKLGIARTMHTPTTAPGETFSILGPAHRVEDPELNKIVEDAAQTLGIPTPVFYVSESPEVNAAAKLAGVGDNRKSVMMMTRGMLESGFTPEELSAVAAHEMAHIADRNVRVQAPTSQVVPPYVVDQMSGVPIRRDYTPQQIRAIEARGGTVDENGVTIGTIRQQGVAAAGGEATRGAPFFEPASISDKSSYAMGGEGSDTGGPVSVPRTITRYRNPLIITKDAPDSNGFYGLYTDALRQLDVRHPQAGLSEIYDKQEGKVVGYVDPQSGTFTRWADHIPESEKPTIQQNVVEDWREARYKVSPVIEDSPVTKRILDDEMETIQDSTTVGSPERREALAAFLQKYGGDPKVLDTYMRLRPGRSESKFGMVENIINSNARRRGHDAVFLFDPNDTSSFYSHPTPDDYDKFYQTDYGKTLKERMDFFEKRYNDFSDAMKEKYGQTHDLDTMSYEDSNKLLNYEKHWDDAKTAVYTQVERDVRDRAKAENPYKWTEIMSTREDRNPVPAPADYQRYTEAKDEAQRTMQAIQQELDFRHYGAGNPDLEPIHRPYKDVPLYELSRMRNTSSDNFYKIENSWEQNPGQWTQGRPGYSVHPDVALPPDVERRSFDASGSGPKAAENAIDIFKEYNQTQEQAKDALRKLNQMDQEGIPNESKEVRDLEDVYDEAEAKARDLDRKFKVAMGPGYAQISTLRSDYENTRVSLRSAQRRLDKVNSGASENFVPYTDEDKANAFQVWQSRKERVDEAEAKLYQGIRNASLNAPPEWRSFPGSDLENMELDPRADPNHPAYDPSVLQHYGGEPPASPSDTIPGLSWDDDGLVIHDPIDLSSMDIPIGGPHDALDIPGYTPGESHEGKWEVFDNETGKTWAVKDTELGAELEAKELGGDYEKIVSPTWTPNFAAGAIGGLAGSQDDEDQQRDQPLGTFTGVALGTLFGPKKINPIFEKNPNLLREAGGALFKTVKADAKLTNPGFFESAYQAIAPKVTDAYARLRQYQDDIASEYLKQTGTLIPADALAAELRRLDSSQAANMMVNRYLKPALNTFRDLGLDNVPDPGTGETQSPIAKILHFYQNVDIAKHFGNYDNTGILADRDFPGGVTAAEAWQYINDFEAALRNQSPEQFQQYQGALKQVWEFNRQLLDIKRESGLITDEAYRDMRRIFPHYVPTRIIDHIADDGFVQAGRSLSVQSNTINALTRGGTTADALNPLAAMISDAYKTHAYANKNKVFNALMGMWMEAMKMDPYLPHSTTTVGKAGTVTVTTPLDASQRRVKEFANLITVRSPRMGTNTNEWVPVSGYVDGTKVNLAVHRDLGDVTKFEAPASIPFVSGLMAAFRAGATSRNPVFLTANASLDFINYMQRETARFGGPTPQNLYKVSHNYARALWETLVNPQVWGDISRQEYRGGAEQFYYQGGGMAGHSNMSTGLNNDWIWRNAPENLKNRPFSQWPLAERVRAWSQNFMEHGLGITPETAAEQEMRRLNRGSTLPVGVGAIAGAGAGGYAGYESGREDDSPGTRFARVLAGAGGGLVAGGVGTSMARGIPRGMLLAESPADIARILKDVVLLKPVEAIGERIELTPRVAAMRNAEWRYKAPMNDLMKLRERAYQRNPQGQYVAPQAMRDRVDAALQDMVQRRQLESTNAGRTTTLDFAKGGTMVKGINQIIPFFNVGVQAAVDVPRAMVDNPVAYTSTALISSILPMILAEVNNNRDAQTARDYADVPNYIKDQGLVWMLPGNVQTDENGNRHPQFIHVRYRQLAPLAVLTREVMQKALNMDSRRPTDDQRRTLFDAALGGITNVSPVQTNSTQDAFLSMVPPALGTGIQLAFNRDTFRGRTIESQAADERASPLSKMLAERLGFSEDAKRPSFWEFLTRDVGSGYAGMWHGAANSILPGDTAPSPQNRPIVGGLVGRVEKGTTGQRVDDARTNVLSDSSRRLLEQQGVLWRPAPVDNVIDDIPLTQEESAKYQRLMNAETQDVIQKFSAIPKFQSLPAIEKQRIFQSELDDRRAVAQAIVMKDISKEERLRRYDRQAKLGHVLPRRNP